MPVIHLEFDDAKVTQPQALQLAEAVRDIVAKQTKIDDVFVYANSAIIKVQVAPVEIFVEMSASKTGDVDQLVARIKDDLVAWKDSSGFPHLLNFTLIPMHWKIEVGI
jgi:hypothetical protein